MPEVTSIIKLGLVSFAIQRKKLKKGVLGQYKYTKSRIYLDPKLNGPQAELTLGHEIAHDWLFQSGYHEQLKPDIREGICDVVGAGLVALLHDNPHLLTVLGLVRNGE